MSLAVSAKLHADFEPSLLRASPGSEGRTDEPGSLLAGTAPDIFQIQALGTLARMATEGPLFVEIPVFQSHSEANSLESFVALQYEDIPHVYAVYRHRVGDVLSFYILLDSDREDALDATFERERFLYERFAGDRLDFQVLPGRELEPCVPSDAARIWRR